jgi:hypothetical protein
MTARDHFRAHGRRRVDLGATLVVRAHSAVEGGPQGVRIRNLGLGGACVELRDREMDQVPVETAVTIEVTAPTLWDPLTLRGRVAWVRRATPGRPARAGIRFEHRESAALYALFQLLGAHAYDA